MRVREKVKKWSLVAGVVLVVAILLSATIRIVPPGHTGVRVFAGQVRGQAQEGFNVVVPFIERMQMMNNRTVAMEMTTEVVTRDLQAVRMNYIVNYQLNQDSSSTVFQTIGVAYESVVLRPIVEETLKDITARYAIEELITERARVSADITSTLQVAFTGRGFTLERFNIVDFQFSTEFATAIESVRIAEQNALRAEQDLERVKFEAEARRENARAQADVLQLQARELTDTNLMAMWIEKWNGVTPVVVSGDSQGFIISLDDIQNYTPPTAGTPDAPVNPALIAENERMREYIALLIQLADELGVEVENPFASDR